MSFFDDLQRPDTLAAVRSRIIAYAQTAQLAITDWIVGAIGQQTFESVAQTVANTTSGIAKIVRSYASLDTSTDPGDADPFDPENVNRTPAPGGLSHYGQNVYSTTRRESTFASGFVTFDNSLGAVPRTFRAEALTFTWTGGTPPVPPPTYKNAPDATIYTNPDGTVTVAAGATLDIPVSADVAGSGSTAPPAVLALTTSLVGVTATNAAAIIGQDRETAPTYRTRCRQAPSRTSLGGPADAYAYLASTKLNGDPLLNADGDVVNINRAQVTQDSSTGVVNAYFASPSGVPIPADVTAANANIQAEGFAVPDAITYTGAAASAVPIPITGTAKIVGGSGIVSATVRQAIVNAYVSAFPDFPVGGKDQVLGAGVIYTADLHGIAANAYPGLYAVVITAPAGAATALALGQVATYAGTIADWTLTIVT
jgi:hypothetical protein